MPKFLGIDPGLNNTGWGIVDYNISYNNYKLINYGVFKTIVSDTLETRLNYIFASVFNLIKIHRPDKIAMEQVFVNINPYTSKKLIMASTASFLAIANSGYKIIEFAPNEIKKAITNNGRSNKELIKIKVQQMLNIKEAIKQTDATDALAIAICIGLINRN